MLNTLYKWIQWLLPLGLAVAIVVIGAYFFTFHDGLSDSSSDWADFGSLIAGVFTFCGSLATIATLLVIHKENEENRSIIHQQAEALTFEQYLKHRDLFIKILSDTAKDCPRSIDLYNLDGLYKKIFPNNKPASRPSYVVEIKSGEECRPGDLSDIVASYKMLKEKLESHSPDCASHLLKMVGMLKINSTEEPFNGDLIFSGTNTGINIYNLESKVCEIYRLVNTLMYFTGNDDLGDISHHANSGILRYELVKHFSNKNHRQDTLYATKNNHWIQLLEKVYIISYEDQYFRGFFRETASHIQIGFSGKDELADLLGNVKRFIECFSKEYSEVYDNRSDYSSQEQLCINNAYQLVSELRGMYHIIESTKGN